MKKLIFAILASSCLAFGQTPKKILFVPTGRMDQAQQALFDELKAKGYDVVVAGQTGRAISPATYSEMSVVNGQVKPGGDAIDRERPPLDIGVCIGNPAPGYQMKPGTVLWNDAMVADYDGFVFADFAKQNYGIADLVSQSGKLVVCGESLTPAETKAEEERKQAVDCMLGIEGGKLSKTQEKALFKKREDALKQGHVWEKVQPLTCVAEPHRIYYRIYKHSTNKSTKVPTDETMKAFVRNILVPKIAVGL